MIRIERPPNFEAILAAFPGAAASTVIFAYGDDIYAPGGVVIPPALLAHEAVHQRNQLAMGKNGPDDWWDLYCIDPSFRYDEELMAHAAEYKAQLHALDRNQRAALLMSTATRLTAPLYAYGSKQPSLSQALRDLRWEIEG